MTDHNKFPSMVGAQTVTVECENCGTEFETLADSREGETVDRPLSYCSIRCKESDRHTDTDS